MMEDDHSLESKKIEYLKEDKQENTAPAHRNTTYKKWAVFACVLLFFCVIGIVAFVFIAPKNEITLPLQFTYDEENKTATVIGYTDSPIGVEIPATINGYTVVKIESNAFKDCESLTLVKIPSSVKEIGIGAFHGCSSLANVFFDKVGYEPYTYWTCTDMVSGETIQQSSEELRDPTTAAALLTQAFLHSHWSFEFRTVPPTVIYPWEKTTLIFQMSENSNGHELTSGAKRYLAGESNDNEDIDISIDERNAMAEKETKVSVTYTYWPDDVDHTWGKNIDKIYTAVNSYASSSPDMYSVFIYDMVGTMLRGCFANTLTNTRGNNYFRFTEDDYDGFTDDEGYMYEYMKSLTLSSKKMYLIASDYFTDLVRSFYVVPVNINLLERNAANVTGDPDGDGRSNYTDLINLVETKQWSFELLKAYCDEVTEENDNGVVDLEGVVGFAISGSAGLSSSGLLYSAPVAIFNRSGNSLTDYNYSYPTRNPTLTDFCVKLKELMQSKGAYVYSGSGAVASLDTIRVAFANNHVLFGGVICVGSLEDEVYQKMRSEGGFGVVPVPLYSDTYEERTLLISANEQYAYETKQTPYLTQIHNLGRIGAIANNSTKFSQCSAFLNYVSINSTEILDEYYNWKLSVGSLDYEGENEKMMRMIRSNVGSGFSKVFEDALGIYGDISGDLYHKVIQSGTARSFTQIKTEPYEIGENMTSIYESLYRQRAECLKALVLDFEVSTGN